MTIRLWSKGYSVHYTDGDNRDLIATDTVRNTVRVPGCGRVGAPSMFVFATL